MLEEYLIGNCSPTLASLKTANLFSMPYESEKELSDQIAYWNQEMEGKGISVVLLRRHETKALVYVCRKTRLEKNLRQPGVVGFLTRYGYQITGDLMDVDAALAHLKERLAGQEGFPHEIGLFLDYPLGDVIGFIENAGHNFKCSGCWKVYCNECEAVKLFARYKKCRDVYLRLWHQGRSVLQLTVAAEPAMAEQKTCPYIACHI